MSLSIIQTPSTASLSQSPMIFSVSSSTDVGNNNFQYKLGLYYWTGSLTDSGSLPNYVLSKYPNQSLVGLFDVSRIINSTFITPVQAELSPTRYYKAEVWTQYYTSSTYFTSSHIQSGVYTALDGYDLFPSQIGATLDSSTLFPILSDGPTTQSVFLEHNGEFGAYVGDINQSNVVTKFVYSGSNGDDGEYNVTPTLDTTNTQIEGIPFSPASAGFPLVGLSAGDTYTIKPYSNTTKLNDGIRYEIQCRTKYPNRRIKWKNRFGQFDYYNFNGVSRESFETQKRTYQPQIGQWDSRTLSVGSYESSIQNYIVDSSQTFTVNTNWLSDDYNDIFKQLLVSDEIYWLYDEQTGGSSVKPLTIKTSNIDFKTSVNDKLIQYTIQFDLGYGYKFII